jgi:putative peptidoglycan lipid II flippase
MRKFTPALFLSDLCFLMAPFVIGILAAIIAHMRQLLQTGTNFLWRKQTSVLSAAMVLMFTYALSNLLGLFKTRLLISVFFSTEPHLLDAYNAAFVIPDTVFQLLVIGSLSAAFIPVFTRYLSKDQDDAWLVASSSMNLVLLAFLVISVLVFIFALPLSRLIAPGFTDFQVNTMSSLLRVMLLAQLFFAVSGFLTGIIQTHQRFLIPALAPLLYNIGIIFGITILSPFLGIFGPAVGVVIGAFLHMLIQIPIAVKLGFRFTPHFNFRHPGVREIVKLMPPRALALGVDQIEHFVSVTLASLLSVGSLSILNVSKLLYAIPSSLFGIAIGQAAFPTLSRQSLETDKSKFIDTFSEALLQIIFLALPISVLFVVLRIPIVRLVYGVPSFPWGATLLTGETLAILAASASFYAVMQLIIRGFYALHDTRTPLKLGLFGAAFDTVAGVLAVKVFNFGIPGIAGAISLTSVFETVFLFVILMKKLNLPPGYLSRINIAASKMGLASIITGVCLWVPMRLLDQFVFDTTRTLPLVGLTAITSVIGSLVYMLISRLLQVEELKIFFHMSQKVIHWKDLFKSASPEPILVPPPGEG